MADNTPRILEIARSRATTNEALHITSLQSPGVAESLGRALAASLLRTAPDIVVVWDQVESAVLGHVVARELHADLVYAFSVEGSLGISGILKSVSRAVVVSYDWTEMHGLDAIVRLTQSQGPVVAGIGSVIAARDLEAHKAIGTYTLVGIQSDAPRSSKEQTPGHDED